MLPGQSKPSLKPFVCFPSLFDWLYCVIITYMNVWIHPHMMVSDHLAGGVMRVTTSCCPLPLHYQANIFTTAAIWPFSGSDEKKKKAVAALQMYENTDEMSRFHHTKYRNKLPQCHFCELLWLSVRCFLCCLVKSADTPRTPDAQINSRLRPFHQGAASRARFTHHPLSY